MTYDTYLKKEGHIRLLTCSKKEGHIVSKLILCVPLLIKGYVIN
jgi:hypothetical protein